MNRIRVAGALSAALLCLVACGTSTGTTPSETLFVDGNTFTGDVSGAEQISADEFRRRVNAGDLTVVSDASLAAQRQAIQKSYDDGLALLRAVPTKSPALQALLAQADQNSGNLSDPLVTLSDGRKVTLLGLNSQVRSAVDSYGRSQSVDNALTDYRQSYSFLPDALRAQVPSPDSLAGKGLADVQAALSSINALLAADPTTLRTARLEPGGGKVPDVGAQLGAQSVTPTAGNGSDHDASCTAPSNFVRRYWFPLKNFVSPVKNQGPRGTCWAFTAVGALESRERVQNGTSADLSEQFVINKYKLDYSPDDHGEGGWSEDLVNAMDKKGQSVPPESFWTYNQASGRTDDGKVFSASCGAYTGSCSDSAHQSERICTYIANPPSHFCAYQSMSFPANNGSSSTDSTQLWTNGQAFDLYRYITYLNYGYTIMASFPVYRGFDTVPTAGAAAGVVSNYDMTKWDASTGKWVPGSRGGHVVQIVGFLSNWDLRGEATPPNIGGGGYFIIKNSWGCGAGDGGYYYVPADYVSSLFTKLSVLNFNGSRSDAWKREQPGAGEAPIIRIPTNPVRVTQDQPTDVGQWFQVISRFASQASLSISSSVDGQIYTGPWNTTNVAASTLNHTFPTAGPRTLTLTATVNGLQAQASLTVNVQAPPPNPNPQITGAGMYSTVLLDPNTCQDNITVPIGTTLVLGDKGCALGINGIVVAPRFYAAITVQNPTNEHLTYDWTLYVTVNGTEQLLYHTLGSASTNFRLTEYGNTRSETNFCRVTVKVNAPDPARSKTQTVWSGRCTYNAGVLN